MITSELYLTLQIGSRPNIQKELREAGSTLSIHYIELYSYYTGISHPSLIHPLYHFSELNPDMNRASFCFSTTSTPTSSYKVLNLVFDKIKTSHWWKT